jgi:hypothetical protein
MSTAVRHEVLKAMSLKSSVLWYVTTCNLVERAQSFEKIIHIHLQDKREVEAAWYTDILVYTPTKLHGVISKKTNLHMDKIWVLHI